MADKRLIIIFWILLIVPAAVVSGVAGMLLLHEQERINRAARDALEGRARALALDIHTTVEAVEQRLSGALLGIDDQFPEKTLLLWEQTNPLVRNVFVRGADGRLRYPEKGLAATPEERAFVTRFSALFSGQVPFDTGAHYGAAEARTENLNGGKPGPESRPDRKPAVPGSGGAGKKRLLDLASAGKSMPAKAREMTMAEAETFDSPTLGWIPWFSQNQLHILGWVKKSASGPVYGMELELACLLSRLIPDLPRAREPGVTWVFLDSRQQVVHQAGEVMVDDAGKADILVPLSDLLPHWQVGVVLDGAAFTPGRGFLIVSGLLLGIFMAAMVTGGLLLSRQARRQMEEAMQKTSFVSSVSHELKTPLTSIRMYAELLLGGRVAKEEKKKQYLEVMVAESQRLTRLINNVLDFGKLEQGRKTYRKSWQDVAVLVRQVIDTHSIRMKNAGFEIVTRIMPGDYNVFTDPDALEQVVLNLVDNALKYAAQGRWISFELREHEPEQAHGTDGAVVLRICDNGPGIPGAHREAIFNKFYRMDQSLTSPQPGSGLGLSIARQILRDLGGDLSCEGRDPGGACFVARITKDETDQYTGGGR